MARETDLGGTLAKIAGGDKAALRSLYVRQSARMFGLAVAILRDRVAAADALQEGFVRIWAQATRFNPAQSSAEAWVAATVRHAALDIARQLGREIPPGEAMQDDLLVDPERLDGLLATDAGKHLHQALLRLDADRRRGVVMAYVNGLSYAELAGELDLLAAKLPAWLHRTMLTLRANLT